MALEPITVVGVDKVLAKLGRYGAEARHLAGAAIYQEALVIMADSKDNYVPVDQGVLKSTGHVELPVVSGNNVSVKMGYGGPAAPYALAVHENPRAGKTGGVSPKGQRYKHWATVGGYKYLERPLLAAVRGFSSRIAARLRGIAVR